MNGNKTQERYQPGQIVDATIEKIGHAGLHCRLQDGCRGYTRRTEAALTRRVINLHQRFRVNQHIRARIIGFNPKYNSIDLSIRQAEEQPWEPFVAGASVGDFVDGDVVMLTESKAIVEILPGIAGILPRHEMWMTADRVDQILMVDDRVRLQIVKIDHDEKLLHLSARGLFADEKDTSGQEATFKIEEKLTSAMQVYRWEQTKQTRRKFTLSATFKSRVKKVYLLLQDENLAAPLLQLLHSFNIDAEQIEPEELRTGQNDPSRTIFILGCLLDQDFDTLLDRFHEHPPEMRILVVGTAEALDKHQSTLKRDPLVGEQLKVPHAAEDLIAALNAIAENTETFAPQPLQELTMPAPSIPTRYDEHSLQELLHELACLTGADNAVIFELNLNSMETKIYGSTFTDLQLSEFDQGHMQFSPISDVIVDGDFVFETGGGHNFKYIKVLGFFESLVGIRVHVTDEYGYGLFFLGSRPQHFSALEKRIFNFCELAVRGKIEHKKLLEKTINEQKFLLTGKMTANFMHEIKNQIQAMEYWLQILHQDSILLNAGKLEGDDKNFLARFDQAVNGAQAAEKRTRNIEELFLQLLRAEDEKQLYLEKYLKTFAQTLQPIAARRGISVQVETPRNFSITCNPSLLNQILINLFMNSMEFISMVRKRTGKIMIKAHLEKKQARPVKIEFSDNGLGVNERNRDKIFELLYTTKKGGSGLGLAISRWLAEQMGGDLGIKDTQRLSGVTFLLELPQRKEGA